MTCRICKNKFISPVSFVCDSCYKKYPINIEPLLIPYDRYNVLIINLNVKYSLAYTYEMSTIYIKLKEFYNCEIIYINNLEFENNGLSRLEIVSKLLDGDIIVITNNIV